MSIESPENEWETIAKRAIEKGGRNAAVEPAGGEKPADFSPVVNSEDSEPLDPDAWARLGWSPAGEPLGLAKDATPPFLRADDAGVAMLRAKLPADLIPKPKGYNGIVSAVDEPYYPFSAIEWILVLPAPTRAELLLAHEWCNRRSTAQLYRGVPLLGYVGLPKETIGRLRLPKGVGLLVPDAGTGDVLDEIVWECKIAVVKVE